MPRTNTAVESLKAEILTLRRLLAQRRQDPGEMPVDGCGDSSCEIAAPNGMATNGGCRCELRAFRVALQWYKRRAAFLEETIRLMKSEKGVDDV